MLILLMMPSVRADSPQIPNGLETPFGAVCFDQQEMSDLANFKKGCDVCKMDLIDTTTTLTKCANAGSPATKWWADSKFVLGGFAFTFTLGVVAGILGAR